MLLCIHGHTPYKLEGGGLTCIVDGYSPTPDRYIEADVVTGNAVVVHTLPAGILSLSDVRYDKTT